MKRRPDARQQSCEAQTGEARRPRLARGQWLALSVVFACAALIYAPSLRYGFYLDDLVGILENPRLAGAEAFVAGIGSCTRPLSELLLLGVRLLVGAAPALYHGVSVGLHLLAGVVFVLVLKDAAQRAAGSAVPPWFIPFGAGVFLLHPIQTESVLYPVQAFSVLPSTILVLLGLLCFLRYADGRRVGHLAAYALCFALAGLARQDAVMMPAVVFAYDALLVAGGWRAALRSRWVAHAVGVGLVAAPVAAVVLLTHRQYAEAGAGFGYTGITPIRYLVSEFPVVVRYIGLLVAPVGQNFDHAVTVYSGFWHVWPVVSFVVLLTLCAAASCAVTARPLIPLGAAWFFLYLVPTSTVMPLRDLMFEHRLYLPLAGAVLLLMGVMGGIRSTRGSAGWVVACIVLASLGVGCWQRQSLWGDDVALWSDAARKSPAKARPWNNIGLGLEKRGDASLAVPYYLAALSVEPGAAVPYFNLAMAYEKLGRLDEAIGCLEYIRAASGEFPSIEYYLAGLYEKRGRNDEALSLYIYTIEKDTKSAPTYFKMANLLLKLTRFREAEDAYRKYLQLVPDSVVALNNLGFCLSDQGRVDEAQAMFNASLRQKRTANAIYGLAMIAEQIGDRQRANEYWTEYSQSQDAEPRWKAVAQQKLRTASGR